MERTTCTISLPIQTYERAKDAAKDDCRSISSLFHKAMEEYLNRAEQAQEADEKEGVTS